MNRYKKTKKKWLNKNDSLCFLVSWTQISWPGNFFVTVDLGNWYYLTQILAGENANGRTFIFRDLTSGFPSIPGGTLDYGAGTTAYTSSVFSYIGSNIDYNFNPPILTRGFQVACSSLTSVSLAFNVKYALV
jgi:hypothetical protein